MSTQKSPISENLGTRLKEWRIKKGLRGIQLANIIGLSSGRISEMESNKTSPSAETITKLLKYTDINIEWLLLGQGPMLREVTSPAPSPALSHTLPPENIPREQLKAWIDDFWQHADRDHRAWLIIEIKRHFPEFVEYIEKFE